MKEDGSNVSLSFKLCMYMPQCQASHFYIYMLPNPSTLMLVHLYIECLPRYEVEA
jgi:hypothetical protein